MTRALARLAALWAAATALAGAPLREHPGFDRHDGAAQAATPVEVVAGAAKGGGLLADVDPACAAARSG